MTNDSTTATLWIGRFEDTQSGDPETCPTEAEWRRYVAMVRDEVGPGVEVKEGCQPGVPGCGASAAVCDAEGVEDEDAAEDLVITADEIWETGEWAGLTADAEISVRSVGPSGTVDLVENPGAIDADLTIGGREVEVTLLPAEDGRPRWETWGSCPDHWISHPEILPRDRDERLGLVTRIEDAVNAAAERAGLER